MNAKEEIIACLVANRDSICRYGVKSLALFGSFVRQTGNEDSDIDLLVEFLPGQKTYDNFIRLVYLLEDLLGRQVDLLTVDSLSPHIGGNILQEAEDVIRAA